MDITNEVPNIINDDNIASFEASYEVIKRKWFRQQKELLSNLNATEEDKTKLIETQSNELTRMLQFYDINKEMVYVVPIEWETSKGHPRLKEITTLLDSVLSKNGNIKPFTRGGDVEFGKWMISVLGYIKFRTVDIEGFEIADQLCMSLTDWFIPSDSDAYSYLQKVMEVRIDRNGKLKNNLRISDLFEDIWTEMKDSQVHKKVQILAKIPVWKYGKDNLEGFNKRYDKYLSQRLGVQNVAAYLDSVPPLRREYYINYIECIPAYIRKEVKYDITSNTTWRAFLKMFTEAEANLKTLEVDFKSHNAHNSGNKSKRYPNYKNKSNKNYNINSYKKLYKENKTTPNGNNITKSDNKSQNDKKPFSQNGNNSKNYKNNYNDNRKGQYKNKFVPNNRYNNKQPGNRGPQVNAIDFDNWGDSLCKRLQEIMLTTKMAALITICLLAIMIPSTEGEFIPGYKWENCHSPRIPYFYRLHDEYLKTVIAQSVSLIPVYDNCEPNTKSDMIFGIDIGNKLLIEWIETNPPRPKEHVYKNNVIQGCNKVPNPIILENNLKYSIIYKEQSLGISEAQQLFQKLCQIRLLFISKCPNWDSPIQEDMNGIDNAIHRKHDDSTKLTLGTISRIGQYQLPEREYNDDSQNNEKFYNKRIILTFNNLKGYTQTLESQIATLLVDKNTMTELLKVKTQALTHSETVRETLKHNGEEIVTLSKSLKEANQKMLTMIPKKEHDDTINKMISKEQHINAVNRIKSDLDSEKQIKLLLITERDNLNVKNSQCTTEKNQINLKLEKSKGEIHSKDELLKNKNIEIENLKTQISNGNNNNNEELTKTNKLYHNAIEEKSKLEIRLKNAWAEDKQKWKNNLDEYKILNEDLTSKVKIMLNNINYISNEVNNIAPSSNGIIYIIKEALKLRLSAINSYTIEKTPLEGNVEKELKTKKEKFEDIIKIQPQKTNSDITKIIKNIVQDVDVKQMGNEYESVLTFLGGIITTMVGRLVKEKIGAYVTRNRQNRSDTNEEGRSTFPNSYRSIGMPLISAPASRITANSARGILVNRDGRVGEQVNAINTPNTPSDNSSDWSPYIQVEMKNNYYQALIDTGATINVITKRVVNEMNLPKENHFIQYITANGDVTTTEGRITHSLKIMNKKYKITFEIIPECKHDIILGMPAIKQVGIKTLFHDRMNRQEEKKRNVYVSNNVTIPPGTCTIFHAKVVPNRNIESNIILDLHPYWKNVDHLLTFEQIGKIHDGIIPIVLINAGRNPVNLKKDTHIGHVHTIQEINEDTLLVTSEEVIPDDADWEETLPSYPSQTDPIDYDSFIELINLSESILTEKGKLKLLEICWKHKTAFYEYDGKPGLYSGKQNLNIKLKTDKIPTRIKPSRMSIEKETEISKQIADMIKSGMIEPSRSPYLSRVVLVRKKDQKWRFVVDFRSINSLIEQQSHVIPRIDKITEEAAGKNYYTSFDLKAGFHQIPLDKNSRKIAAFITHEGIFQYKVMPMGLTGSPDKFQEIMDEVLFRLPNCYVYLDDILTCTTSEDTHLSDIEAILERITKFNMKINVAKCQFGRPSAQYLGFVLDKYGIHPNTEKVKAINSKPIPRTQKRTIADPLYKLDKKFVWEEMHTNAFNKLKNALSNAATLSPPDNTKNYTIFTDASKQGLGAALVQKDRPIAFASRSLKPAEKNYPIIKLEALGLIYALKQFRPYIYGKHTIVITDHKPLLALLKNKELTGILQRYQMAIMEYDLTIQYIKGEANNVADYLSRETFMAIDVKENLLEEVFPLNMFPPYKIDKFIEYYNEKEKDLISKNGKIRTASGTRIYVPKLLREKLLTVFHNHPLIGGHLGYDKINGKFKSIFYWPKMDEQMTTIWTSCHECQLNKEQPSRLIEIHKKTLQYPNEIWCTLNADFMQYNNEYILVIVDEYSKFVVASVSKKQNAPTLLNTLIKYFSMIGFPKVLRSDNGPAFIAKSVAEYLKSMGIDHQLSAPYNHTSNAFAERFNNTLRAAIRVYKNEQTLSVIVAHFMYAYNRTKNLKTGLTPAQILLNSSDKWINEQPIHNGYSGLHELIKDTKERFDNDIQRQGKKLSPGDLVLRKIMIRKDSKTSQKNQPTWEGPFKIVKHLYGDTYEIERTGRKTRSAIEKVHADRLKLYIK